jgi:hypothetical protein
VSGLHRLGVAFVRLRRKYHTLFREHQAMLDDVATLRRSIAEAWNELRKLQELDRAQRAEPHDGLPLQ